MRSDEEYIVNDVEIKKIQKLVHKEIQDSFQCLIGELLSDDLCQLIQYTISGCLLELVEKIHYVKRLVLIN